MKIAFTICENNHLAQAKLLIDSTLKHNSDYKFFVILCDKKRKNLDYSIISNAKLIEVPSLEIEKFDEMANKYDDFELKAAIKPFVFDYFYKTYSDAEKVIFLDAESAVFSNFEYIEKELEYNAILLIPNITQPIAFDGELPDENTFTNFGLYNSTFLATRRDDNTTKMINWWKERMEKNCFNSAENGIFIDQLPLNFVPIFFKKVKISQNLGINLSPWNLHERHLLIVNNKYFINNLYPLIIYNFSNTNPFSDVSIAEYCTRVNLENNKAVQKLYNDYKKALKNTDFDSLKKIKSAYNNDCLCKQFISNITCKLKNLTKKK